MWGRPMQDDATLAQVLAANPQSSIWLAANAGSGKTRVLTDRVARLLLAGTEPQKILCLTYTKAAASEMQNRLFRRLGQWAMMEEGRLRGQLAELGVTERIDSAMLARARRLFARAIETPGGLKIQTIHAFCAALLRRFPIEARVSPDFSELDDRSAILMRREIVEEMAAGEDRAAVDALAGLYPGDGLDDVLAEISRNSDGFYETRPEAALKARFGLSPDQSVETLLAQVFLGGEAELIAALVPLLLGSGANDSKAGAKLKDFRTDTFGLALLEEVLLFGAKAKAPFGAKIGDFPTRGLANGAAAPLMPRLEALMLRVEAARETRLALAAAEKALALHQFASAFLARYGARKAGRGFLDFDDLIHRAADLLSDRSVAAWVLFRLDGGIDHILVDEAQDTSPSQWRVIERLAEEFTAGEGASGRDRRIFVVGDKKQSIYSFQGADLETFDRMRAEFAARHRSVSAPFQPRELLHSFRSSAAILHIVDLTFDERVNRGLGGPTLHRAFHADMPGRVDLWEPIPKTAEPEPEDWDNPVDLLADSHETVLLANRIAAEIGRIIKTGTALKTREGTRALHEGDFLILVRRRGALFQEIIRACKAAGLRVAGADRLRLGAELAVKDILALLSFLALPEDDLSLAAVLRSPLFGWSEAALYDLAAGRRAKEYLWQALRVDDAQARETLAVLTDLRDSADFLRPYELIERILTRHDGRRKLLARLGPEAEDGIDALLAETLGYEQGNVPSLTGFLVWMQTGEIEVKRRLDSASRAIRVMTVHGAKGLEAPVVILPDTAKWPERIRGQVARAGDGAALWRVRAEESPALLRTAAENQRRRERDERMRLLYVAMTRAESWLIVCAAGETGSGEDSWHSLISAAMDKAGATGLPDSGEARTFGPGKRYQTGIWPEAAQGHRTEQPGDAPALPDWVNRAAPPAERPPAPLTPTGLGGPKALAGTTGQEEEVALARGSAIHLLLEHLAKEEPSERAERAKALLRNFPETDTVLTEAERVLDAPHLRALFAPNTFCEVEVSAPLPDWEGRVMQGVIDRLVVSDDHVLAVDFKSNTQVPSSAQAVPEGILRQMGAYAAILEQIYPGRRVELAIVWTATTEFMPIPLNIVRAAMQNATLP
ncbi:MAG TPA: double-strand break repair helicase AddA [Paracoccaceae bacterium]|nr:double-strand break repair helicase AddA [Paracoccaceae bacterium]